MLDNRKIAYLRLALIRAGVNKGQVAETALLAEVRPVIGELLALADAALKIRKVYKRRQDQRSHIAWMEMSKTVETAMRDLDDLEGASRG